MNSIIEKNLLIKKLANKKYLLDNNNNKIEAFNSFGFKEKEKEKIRFKRKNINFNQMNNRINNDIMNKDKKMKII